MLCCVLNILAFLATIPISNCNITAVKHAHFCLPEPIPEQELRFLIYHDKTKHSVRIPYASWTSARIAAEVTYILMREVLGYSVLVLDGTSAISSQPVNYVAGCMDANDAACEIKDVEKPVLHLTVETWAFGISRADALPQSVSPTLLNVLNYKTTNQWYVWQDVVDDGANSDAQLVLDYYKSYKNSKIKPHIFFDHWTKIFELIPNQYIARCSELGPDSYQDRMSERYIELTNDTDVGCHFNDTIWFSKSCRANRSECIPLLLQYNYVSAMQLSFFLEMPLAIVKVYDGSEEFDRVYYSAIRKGKFIFDWFQPDDSLADEYGRLPVLLILPPMKPLEQSQHIYKTGYASVSPRNYCWKGLPAVDRHVAQLASKIIHTSKIKLYDEDMDNMMLASRRLKDGDFKETSVEFRVACDWVRQHEPRWRPWIPARCPPAAAPDPTLTACLPCSPGSFCEGGFDGPLKCPAGHYCPANVSRPVPCPTGRSTADGGARHEEDCAACASGYVLLSDGSCMATASALSLIVVLVAAAAAAAAALVLRLRASRSQTQWAVKPSEIVMDVSPDVLGCGSQSAVVRALYRGTPVAVKYFVSPQARSSVPADRDAVPAKAIERAHPGGSFLHFEWSYGRSRRAKVSPAPSVGTHGVDRALLGAMRQMARVRHPSVATVMGVAELAVAGQRRVCVVMELYELGCLRDLLQNRSYFLHGETALSLLRSVAQGMRFLHEACPPLLHGALKSSNVLIDTKHGAKISDWGLPPPRLGPPGPAPLWAAPEVLRGQVRASRAADVYSFGVVLYEVLSRRPPFGGEDSDAVAVAIADGSMRLPAPRGSSVEAAALMKECLAFSFDARPHFGEVGRRLSALHHSQMTSEAVLPSEPALPGETPLPRLRRQRVSSCRFSPLLLPAAVSASPDEHMPCLTDALPPPALSPPAATGKLDPRASAASLTLQACESAPAAVETESFCLRDTKKLIRRLFPLHVADALMRGERVPPQHLDMVTMFFSDVVGFTDLSAATAPEKVSDLLDRLYGRLDALADVHGVSKLETIGDAYLCATNLAGDQATDHAARLARFAVAAVRAARDTPVDPDDASLGSVRIRVGLHSGPCMASVVGNRFPKYTLLGDTVNTASRMESHSVPGRVQCTARTAELIRAQDPMIPLAPRGETIIKGKGPMITFWVIVDDEPGNASLPVTSSADSVATTAVPCEACEDQDAEVPLPGPPLV